MCYKHRKLCNECLKEEWLGTECISNRIQFQKYVHLIKKEKL